ncbi:8-oxoguanine deaminase [Nocardia macrotermitis]|uniref:8-oxoguanine deaminase n=1 Tax=Nocardia macrotermitis TaxID=2585198 RepID=A0A7K0D4G3_9NOCA|nr:8-oxoguanine deaminase [Nocardia macrotermitis]MQY20609.1 8-oxoguanine deaminase [Nocardia macrotermitis]
MSRVAQADPAAHLSAGRRIIIENAYLAPVVGAEIANGYLTVENGRITALGSGPAPLAENAERIDATGCLVTPGLVNTHHHLYQWATQGMFQDATLFEWLTGLYRTWAHIDADITYGAAAAGLGWLALGGTTTSTDHHYVFPSGRGDLFEAEVRAAAEVGLRFHPCRGSMDRGRSAGGLPPDEVVETIDRILDDTAATIDKYHDPSFDSMLRVAVAPCSPFSVTETLMRESAILARDKGVRLHTHLAETLDEEQHCREQMGCTPVEYMEQLGWLGPDVWFAHAVHLHDNDIRRFAETGSGTAHCPSSNARLGAGIARVRDLLAAGAPVGLGVDGAASSELTSMAGEMRQAMLFQRAVHGPTALTARQALEIGTLGGARNLGRHTEIGSLEPGKLADIAIWRVDGFRSAVIDPVCALVFGPTPPLARLLVGGRTVVENDELPTVPQDVIAAAGASARERLLSEESR